MRSRSWVLLLAFAGCAQCTMPSCDWVVVGGVVDSDAGVQDPADEGDLIGWVVDADGPVANAELRLLALKPALCPCPPGSKWPEDEWDAPECACPAALDEWLERTRTCRWPMEPIVTFRSAEDGRVALPRFEGANAIEVISERGVFVMPIPESSREVALEVGRSKKKGVTLALPDGGVIDDRRLRGAFLYESGYCVPLVRESDAWLSAAPVAEGSVLVIDAPGLSPVVRSAYRSHESVVMQPPLEVASFCERWRDGEAEQVEGATIRLVSPFHRGLTTVSRSEGDFALSGVPALPASVTCERSGEVVARWSVHPTYGLVEENEHGEDLARRASPARCVHVEVTDQDGRPVEGAEVTDWTRMGNFRRSGPGGGTTDAQGRVCLEGLEGGGEVSVEAPSALGGHCAGRVELDVPESDPASNPPPLVRVTLPLARIAQGTLRGRVVSEEGRPVAGAHIYVNDVSVGDGCSSGVREWIETGPDGVFSRHSIPIGPATVKVRHPWFAEREFEVDVDGTAKDLVLDRGASWRGRVLDPDGQPVTSCQLFLSQPGNHILSTGHCQGGVFELKALPHGKATLKMFVRGHATLGDRTLLVDTEIREREQREQDLRWRPGAAITGRVVSLEDGTPVPGLGLNALPLGTRELNNQFHPSEVRVITDGQGRFAFNHLSPGTWVLKSGHRELARLETGAQDVVLTVPKP